MKTIRTALFLWLTGLAGLAQAQLNVAVSSVKVEGNKAVIKLAFSNDLTNAVESARASVILLDRQSKILGQATEWVIGGSKDRPPIAPGATNIYFFVITSDKPLPKTNLAAQVNFNRLVLEGGKLGDVRKDVQIQK